jgi:hypothetical protein
MTPVISLHRLVALGAIAALAAFGLCFGAARFVSRAVGDDTAGRVPVVSAPAAALEIDARPGPEAVPGLHLPVRRRATHTSPAASTQRRAPATTRPTTPQTRKIAPQVRQRTPQKPAKKKRSSPPDVEVGAPVQG